MKKRAVVYPYDKESAPLLRFRELLVEYEVVAALAPPGFGLTGKDAGIAIGGETIGIRVGESIEHILEDVDAVIVPQPENHVGFDVIGSELTKAALRGKDLVFLYKPADSEYDELLRVCAANGTSCSCLENGLRNGNCATYRPDNEQLLPIHTPVLFVAGLSERTNKFDIQLGLRRYFLEEGYRVSQIGSRAYCEIFGFRSFPAYMLESSAESSKIIYFNRLCKQIEREEKPDILIIGIPGGIMPYNATFTNKFGVLAFEISQAMSPDAAVLSLLFEDVDPLYLDKLHTSVKYKLGFEVDCFNLSNQKFEWNISRQEGVMNFMTVGTQGVDKKKSNLSDSRFTIFNSLNQSDMTQLSCHLEGNLLRYAAMQEM
ncbi:TIGR04066 family peptide maturation system protein [Paenibacillus sp. TH7-28]